MRIMAFFHYAQKLYSLDTLDTRFTNSSSTSLSSVDPAKATPKEDSAGNSQGKKGQTAPKDGPASSRWGTPEFFFYYVVFIICVSLMFKTAHDVSTPNHPNYKNYADRLSLGWIPGYKFDDTDAQYSTFRENVPYMFMLLVIHPLLRRTYEYLGKSSSPLLPSVEADARLDQRATFDLCFAIVYLVALNGFSALKVFLILYINYGVATQTPNKYVPAVTWVFNIGILFANELCGGYPYSRIVGVISPWSKSESNWGSFLDSYGGLLPRWEILFNITVLRLISFNMDYCWSLRRWSYSDSVNSPIEKLRPDPKNLSERDRIEYATSIEDYCFRNYLAYVLYAPLYLAGPIITFNDYISQSRITPKSISLSRTLLYGIRFLVCLLTMEVMLHLIYAVAISKSNPYWDIYTPFQLSMLGYFNLHIIWLKLLLPWRFFRLWSLFDGIDPPENMVRCMSDNYSALAFWRGWHRSLNRWIIRYIYIPLGGSGRSESNGLWAKARTIFNYLIIFTFVALWHDINLKLLMWGWLITLFIVPEVLAGLLFPRKKWQNHREAYRWICGVGAVGNILLMMAANLVGFAVGIDGLKGLVQGIIGSYAGVVYMAAACATLFVGVQIMFETREEELRRGIKMKC